MKLRKAIDSDLSIIMDMVNNGREHIHQYKINQWVNGYPSVDIIKNDISSEQGYVLLDENNIVGYFAKLNHDECYDQIEGSWLNDSPYVAIHRTVVKEFNKGLGSKMFDEIKKQHKHIRVDTHEGNISMNKCLLNNGFKYCGIIYLKDGNPRNAYEYIEA